MTIWTLGANRDLHRQTFSKRTENRIKCFLSAVKCNLIEADKSKCSRSTNNRSSAEFSRLCQLLLKSGEITKVPDNLINFKPSQRQIGNMERNSLTNLRPAWQHGNFSKQRRQIINNNNRNGNKPRFYCSCRASCRIAKLYFSPLLANAVHWSILSLRSGASSEWLCSWLTARLVGDYGLDNGPHSPHSQLEKLLSGSGDLGASGGIAAPRRVINANKYISIVSRRWLLACLPGFANVRGGYRFRRISHFYWGNLVKKKVRKYPWDSRVCQADSLWLFDFVLLEAGEVFNSTIARRVSGIWWLCLIYKLSFQTLWSSNY